MPRKTVSPHGTRTRYNHFKCRCDKCREANREYDRKHNQRMRKNQPTKAIVLYGQDGLSQRTGVMCPTGCGNEVVYNGNYFCDNFDHCGWAFRGENDDPLLTRCLKGLESNRRGEYKREILRP